MIDYWFGLCDLLEMPRIGPKPILLRSAAEDAQGARRLEESGLDLKKPFVVFNPGAAFGPTKLWPNPYWAQLAEMLGARFPEMQLVITPGPGEEAMAENIRSRTKAKIRIVQSPVLSLSELKPVLARAALMVTTDSGPRHIAVAFDTPHLVIMGPTHSGYTNRNLEKATILQHDLPCGPCHLKVCPLGHECMTGLLPQEVFDAAEATLLPNIS
jgi:heptosyltransferase-2